MKSFSIGSVLLVFFYFSIFFTNGKTENIAINPLKEMSESFFKNFMSEFIKSNQSMTTCVVDLIHWYNAISKRESWSLQMLDSWGKIPAGVLNGNAYSLGNYDECINSIELEQRKIKGKYCLVELPFDIKFSSKQANVSIINNTHIFDEFEAVIMIPKRKRKGNNVLVYTNGICIPHTCKSVEIENILQVILKVQNLTDVKVIVDQDYCVTNDPLVWRTIDWIAFDLFSFVGILILLSTLYEFFTKYCCKKENNSDRLHKLLTSFSITTNTMKLLSISGNSLDLKFLNGIKAISIIFIIIVHRCVSGNFAPLTNLSDVEKFKPTMTSGIIASMNLAVDSFFVVGGFLISFTVLKKTIKAKNFNVLLFYLHRIIRITPAVAASLLFYTTLLRYLGSGPLWNKYIQMYHSHCDQNWWYTLLYIQNYVDESYCMPYLWYLSVDMQLYILSPILIYAFLINKKMGWINIILWMLALQIALIVIVFENKWNAGIFSMKSIIHRMRDHYLPTHTRAIPWLIGFCLGCLLTGKSRNAIKMNKFTVVSIWISCLTIMSTLIYVMKPLQSDNHKITHLTDSMFNAFAKNIWALCISWIIAACYFGYGGPINKFLSLSIWQTMGKLTLSMYLIHFMVILRDISSTRHPKHWSIFGSLIACFGDIILTLMISFLLTISIELPISNIEQVVFSKKKTKTEAGLTNLTTIKQ